MSDDPQVSNISVSGGAASASANMDDLLTLAGQHQNLAAALESLASQVAGIASDGDLFAAALLDPAGVAVVEGMLGDALNGRLGLYTLSNTLAEHAEQVQAVHDFTASGDAQQSALMQGAEWLFGASGVALPSLAAEYVWSGLTEGPQDPLSWILAHPGVVNRYGNALPGLLHLPPWMSYQDAAGLITRLWPGGEPQVTRADGIDKRLLPREAPAGLGDLMSNLSTRNDRASAGNDEIDVQRIVQPDGTTAYIVNIPGTKDLALPTPGEMGEHSNDMYTNLVAVAGEQSAREEAIAMALEEAGVSSTDPVMLVGHSQGGIIAAQAAADTANGTFNYNVTHVVTAASPVALADIPDDVQVLSLENRNDLIPQTDAADNPATANHTTVSFDYDTGIMGDNHALEDSYQDAAEILDDQMSTPASGLGGAVSGTNSAASSSVTSFMDGADVFFADESGDTRISTQVFDIERVP